MKVPEATKVQSFHFGIRKPFDLDPLQSRLNGLSQRPSSNLGNASSSFFQFLSMFRYNTTVHPMYGTSKQVFIAILEYAAN